MKIDWFWAEFRLYFQYNFDLSEVRTIPELKTRLLDIQKKLYAVGKSIRQKAKRRVLSGKSNLFDYQLELKIMLYDEEDKENILPSEDFKFNDPFKSWTDLHNDMRDRIFSDIEYQLEGLGLNIEKALSFNLLWADFILKYSHRFPIEILEVRRKR